MIRQFSIGDEWIYYKIYSGAKFLDELLVNELHPLINKYKKEDKISEFFFIRFTDPRYHLRVRFRLRNVKDDYSNFISDFNQLLKKYLATKEIYTISQNVYNREIERYGANSIELVEQLFSIDSDRIITFLNQSSNEPNEQKQWLYAVSYIDHLLSVSQFNIYQKVNILDLMKNQFESEINKHVKVITDLVFRENRKELVDIISSKSTKSHWDNEGQKVAHDSHLIEIKTMYTEGDKIEAMFLTILTSIIHMHINRLFRTKQRAFEIVIYCVLHKFYESEIAKLKYSKKD